MKKESVINVSALTPEEKFCLLQELIDNTNISITGAYGSETTIDSDDIRFVKQEHRKHYYYDDIECDYLIEIRTGLE